jgi:TonB family protein
LAALDKRPGKVAGDNQEPLGSSAIVFREYIALVNSRIYPSFDKFLLSISSVEQKLHRRFGTTKNPFYVPPPDLEESSKVFKDFSMSMLAELEIQKSGMLGDVRVIRASGDSAFDCAAVWSIFKGAPFPPPPEIILSWNDCAYLRWRFHRRQNQNGPFAGQGFILKPPVVLEKKDMLDASVNMD